MAAWTFRGRKLLIFSDHPIVPPFAFSSYRMPAGLQILNLRRFTTICVFKQNRDGSEMVHTSKGGPSWTCRCSLHSFASASFEAAIDFVELCAYPFGHVWIRFYNSPRRSWAWHMHKTYESKRLRGSIHVCVVGLKTWEEKWRKIEPDTDLDIEPHAAHTTLYKTCIGSLGAFTADVKRAFGWAGTTSKGKVRRPHALGPWGGHASPTFRWAFPTFLEGDYEAKTTFPSNSRCKFSEFCMTSDPMVAAFVMFDLLT